jgi:glycosyltransferase involved in cell wall biosynthesis
VVDDGSTDCTRRLLEEFRDDRIKVVASPHLGPAGARNRGVQFASAPLIAYLDSDNTWRPDFLRVMGEAVRADGDAVLWYCGQRTTFWERTADGRWAQIESLDQPRRQFRLEDVWELRFADVNSIVHRRDILATVGGWDERCWWLEDWDFFARVFLRYPDRVRSVPRILTDYRQVSVAAPTASADSFVRTGTRRSPPAATCVRSGAGSSAGG